MFNVGDRVKILKNTYTSHYDEYIGTEATVVGINESFEFPVDLEMHDGEWLSWSEEELELVPQGVQVKIKRLSPDSVVPTYATTGAACFDLYASEDILVQPGETVAVATGLAFEIPEGYQMKIHPRSGISLKTPLRIANAPGCIDSDFRGELKVLLWNSSSPKTSSSAVAKTLDGEEITPEDREYLDQDLYLGSDQWSQCFYEGNAYVIRKGERLAQAEIVPVIRASFIESDELSETERTGGFGSTGIR